MLVSKIINSAMRKIEAVASGETITPDEEGDALEALQVMLRSWAVEKINVFVSVHETFTLVAGTSEYTWGVGGTINTLRPNEILFASIADADLRTYQIELIPQGKYRNISKKTLTGRPYYLYANYAFPYIQIYLYPVPTAAETLLLDSVKPFTEASSFDSVDDTLQMPTNYEEPIIYNLAVRLAPEFGKSVPKEVAAIAISSYDRIMRRNSGNYVEPVRIVLPAGSRGGYNINRDS